MSLTIAEALRPLPPADDPRGTFEAVLEALEGEADQARIAGSKDALAPVFARAPFLAETARQNAQWLASALETTPEKAFEDLRAAAEKAASADAPEGHLGETLRRTKARFALLAAILECGGIWSTETACGAISDFADTCLDACLDFLITEAADAERITLEPGTRPGRQSGLTLLALGKLGGRELNYSSDIDIVAFYDVERANLADPENAQKFYERIVRRLVALMQERTEHGYVFRTDVRLRPDPGSTPVALSVDAALGYYESRGQNWERAAWIKARAAAGDLIVGEWFLGELAPFIWRKHLDFAAIADIQAMKRQINAAHKVGGERARGHNVKLGRGGVREIEFFAQTQQLIAGGREPDLRRRGTVLTLETLAENRFIAADTASDLTSAYWYLRAVENRVQMINDAQTHSLPEADDAFAAIAGLMGESDPETFATRYRATLTTVIDHYAALFAGGTSLASTSGNLVFTGSDDDPDTIATLTRLGFRDAIGASAVIRKWHYGGYAATRADKARQHLTELMPVLLEALASTGNADEALKQFDTFLSKLPAGVQLFALLRNSDQLRRVFIDVMAAAPKMMEAVLQRVHIVDGLIDPAFYAELPTREELTERIDGFLDEARDFEEFIDRARIMGQEQIFLTSAGLVAGTLPPGHAGAQFTTIADTLLRRIFEHVSEAFAERHGKVPGADAALLAFGKFASQEMTAASDLDFILIYDAPEGADHSDGARPLETPHYYARLTQRLIAALSAPTAQGVLYEADMRLRPSGNAGPLATSFRGFSRYQREKAWTWEHLALTRARAVLGTGGLDKRIEGLLEEVRALPREPQSVLTEVRRMRELMARERKPKNLFDLKLVRGGLVDLEFMVQSARLIHPDIFDGETRPTSDWLRLGGDRGIFANGERLAEIYQRYSSILQLMSACLIDPFAIDRWSEGFRELLLRVTNQPDLTHLETVLTEIQAEAAEAFDAFIPPLEEESEPGAQ